MREGRQHSGSRGFSNSPSKSLSHNESHTQAHTHSGVQKGEEAALTIVAPQAIDLNDWSGEGLTTAKADELRTVYGPNAVRPKQKREWVKVAERYVRTTPILLLIAALLSVCIESEGRRDWMSFGLLLFLLNVMVWADYLGERSASSAIAAVEKLGAPECRVKRDGSWQQAPVADLVPGDVVWLKAGVVVPADGVSLCSGKPLSVDESSLTGESVLATKGKGAELLSGSVIQKGEGEMLVCKTGAESFYGKTIALLARAERKGHLRTVLDAAAKTLTLTAVVFALFLIFWERFWKDWWQPSPSVGILFKRAFTLIAAVIPAAMPVVTTTVLAVGAVSISKEHAIVSRLSAIEEAAGVEILCSDKTGTLTMNVLTLLKEEMSTETGFTGDQLLLYASLASTLTDPEPIDKAINDAVDMEERKKYQVLDYTPFNPVDKKADSLVKGPDGELMFVAKGAPHIILDMVCPPGDIEKRERLQDFIKQKAMRGLRTLGVAIKKHSDTGAEELGAAHGEDGKLWQLVGYLCISDPPRADTKDTLERSKNMGVCVKMLTGDQQAIAAETARLLGMGSNISGPEVFKQRPRGLESDVAFLEYIRSVDGFSGVFPEHKFDIVDILQQGGCLVAMTGDGVNDAPALKRATVGIAVSGATEAARAAADIILLAPGLSSIITVFSLSRQIFKRIEAYIIFRIHSSLLTLFFWWGCVVCFNYGFPTWVLVLVAMINDFVLMSCSKDRVPSSKEPLKWSMLKVSAVATLTSFTMAVGLLLFILLADPQYGINFWTWFGLEPLTSETTVLRVGMPRSLQTSAGVWLLLTVCIQLSFHICRTPRFAFQYDSSNFVPSPMILVLQLLATVITLLLSVYWKYSWVISSGPRVVGIPWGHAGVTILYGIIWFLIADVLKVGYFTFIWPRLYRLEAALKQRIKIPSKDELRLRGKARLAMKTMEEQRRARHAARKAGRKAALEAAAASQDSSSNVVGASNNGRHAKGAAKAANRQIRKKTAAVARTLKRHNFELARESRSRVTTSL